MFYMDFYMYDKTTNYSFG